MTKVAYHCCSCQWIGKRAPGSFKPCPACMSYVAPGYAYECPECTPNRPRVAPKPVERESAFPGGRVPHVLYIKTLDTQRVQAFSIPKVRRARGSRR